VEAGARLGRVKAALPCNGWSAKIDNWQFHVTLPINLGHATFLGTLGLAILVEVEPNAVEEKYKESEHHRKSKEAGSTPIGLAHAYVEPLGSEPIAAALGHGFGLRLLGRG